MQVTARLYLREKIAKLGIAPLTSMFAFGENQPGRDDYRPEVHDSDGLSVATGDGEWIWRPLVNPRRLLVTSFAHDQPARLRPDAARPLARQLRRPRGALRAAPERVGRAGRQLGRGPGRAGADPDARRDQRQHRRLLGAADVLPAPGQAVRLRATGSAGRAQARCRPARAGSCRRDAVAASPSSPTATSTTSSISTARRCVRCRHPTEVEPVIWVDANAEVRERNLFKQPRHRRLAHDRALQAQRRRTSRSSCAPT